jgi:hypothetical protein
MLHATAEATGAFQVVHVAEIRWLCSMIRLMNLLAESTDRLAENLDLFLGVIAAFDHLSNDFHAIAEVVALVDVSEVNVTRVWVAHSHVRAATSGALMLVDDHSPIGGLAPIDVVEPLSHLSERDFGH